MKLVLFLTFISFQLNASEVEQICQRIGGKFYQSYTCPKSKLKLKVKTCEFKNDRGELMFFNGCSGPAGGFKNIFTQACINHDHCYHHEPTTNGLSQKDCDLKLRNEMIESCKKSAGDKIKKCINWSNLMYRTLRIVGGIAFRCDNSYAHY